MIVQELIKVLSKFPEDEEVSALFAEDTYGDDIGVTIEESGVYIKLG